MTGHPTDALTGYLDDALSPTARRTVATHLSECADCRRVLAELTEVKRRAAEWRPTPPTSDPWPAIRRAVLREPRPRPSRRRWWPIGIAVGSLAAALLVWTLGPTGLPSPLEPPRSPSASGLDSTLDAQWLELQAHLSPGVIAPVADALATIDVSLHEIAAAMVDDPQSPLLQALYERALADKVTVLNDATARLIPTRKG